MEGFFSQPGAGARNPWTISASDFRTAKQQLLIENKLNGRKRRNQTNGSRSECEQSTCPKPMDQSNNDLAVAEQQDAAAAAGCVASASGINQAIFGPYRNPLRTNADSSSAHCASDTSNPLVSTVSSKPPGLSRTALTKSRSHTGAAHAAPLANSNSNSAANDNTKYSSECEEIFLDERAKNLEKAIVEKILNEIVSWKSDAQWSDIAGLRRVKQEINEIIELPQQIPLIYGRLLKPTKGLLLFGPPGTGKTMIGKCIANQSNSTFFSISASSLTSKWVGEGEKLVRALFVVARIKQPSVIFIDEIDSLLTQRSESDHESSRRLKTEFLVQFDGMPGDEQERVLVIGATNRPQELDEAARRRFTKRLYIPLPAGRARRELVTQLMRDNPYNLTTSQLNKLCEMTHGYSGADMNSLCQQAVMNMIRRVGVQNLKNVNDRSQLPPTTLDDFLNAVRTVKATVSPKELQHYLEYNRLYGVIPNMEEDDDAEDKDVDTQESVAGCHLPQTSSAHCDTNSVAPCQPSDGTNSVDADCVAMECQTSSQASVREQDNNTDSELSVYVID